MLTLTCKEATRLCSEELDRDLDLRERLTLRMHLLICTGCTNFRAHMQALRQASRALAEGKADLTAREP